MTFQNTQWHIVKSHYYFPVHDVGSDRHRKEYLKVEEHFRSRLEATFQMQVLPGEYFYRLRIERESYFVSFLSNRPVNYPFSPHVKSQPSISPI
jgi:hypothetical protein